MTAVGTCSASGCQIADGGSCIEGFPNLGDCPNFSSLQQKKQPESRDDGATPDEQALAKQVGSAEPALALSSGRALTVEEGHGVTGERRTKVVVLIGMVKSGKTTVLSELYERFCKGPIGGYLFAGSKTIMGFEQICYFARAVSERGVEDTDRTKIGIENNLLHLDLVRESDSQRQGILISDLSGELFKRAVDSRQNVQAIPYLRRADHVVLFADAEKLGDNSKKHHLVTQLMVLLRTCIEERRIGRNCRVALVISRHDLLPANVDGAFLETMKDRIRVRAASYFRKPVICLELAARPQSGPDDAYGLERLLSVWLEKDDDLLATAPTLCLEVGNEAREIDKFAYKVPADD